MFSRSKLSAIALTISLLFTVLFTSRAQDPASNKKRYERTGKEASLSGTITFVGKPPQPIKIDTSAQPVCDEVAPNLQTEWYAINNDRLANVFIYVTSDTLFSQYSFEAPGTVVVIQHRGCRYEPRVLGMQAGQTLMVINNDNFVHNTHPYSKINEKWNISMVGGATIVKTFERPEFLIPVRDNQHPWQTAYLGVFNHPFFAVSDSEGNYRIEGLPTGTYKVNAWHEKLGEKTFDLTVGPGEFRQLNFQFAKTDKTNN